MAKTKRTIGAGTSRRGIATAITRACGVAVASMLVLVGAAPAPARATTLTAAERAAIRIQSVSVADDPTLGVIAQITFAGNVEQVLGQGGLTGSVIALVVQSAAPYQPIDGVLDAGGGAVVTSLPSVHGHGKKARARWRTTTVQASDLQIPVGPDATGATTVRDGNRLIMWLPALGVPAGATISVKVLADGVPGATAATDAVPGTPPKLSTASWTSALQARATESATAKVTVGSLSADELSTLAQVIGGLRSDLGRQVSNGNRVKPQISAALQTFARSRRTVSAGAEARGVSPQSLRGVLTALSRGQAGLTAVSGRLGVLASEVSAIQVANTNATVNVTETSNAPGVKMSPQGALAMTTLPPVGVPTIAIDPTTQYQRFEGIGAAMTDSAAGLITTNLSPAGQGALMQALFGPTGGANALGLPNLGLSFLRIPIGASGAMTYGGAFSYDDVPPGQTDPSLSSFSTQVDQSTMVPAVLEALTANPSLTVLATPWSAPAWMKTNDMLGNPTGDGELLPADYGAYARYLVEYLQAYAAAGVPIDALTPQNEPSTGLGGTPYPGMELQPVDEGTFVHNYLVPALNAAGLHPQIFGNDLSWDANAYATALAQTPALGDLTGMAWHCYYGSPTVMSTAAQADPGLQEIVDECSPEIRGFGAAEAVISSLRNWASIYSVWTAVLDPLGGPIQTPNHCGGCTGLATINEATGSVTPRLEYYQLAQVSNFVHPGAVRIGSTSFVTYGLNTQGVFAPSTGLDDVAFQNLDGSTALVTYNNSTAPVTFGVADGGRYFTATLPARAMATYSW